jgi:hypothetical protein
MRYQLPPPGKSPEPIARREEVSVPVSVPVGYGLIRAGVRTDSMIGVTKFRIQKMLNIYVVPLELAAPDQTVPYRTVLSGDAFRALHARLRSRLSLRDPLANISQQHLASLHRSQIFGDL